MSDHDANTTPPPAGDGAKPSVDAAAVKATLTSMHKLDLGMVIAGAVVLLASLLPFYNVKFNAFGINHKESINAWNSIVGGGFFGWFGVVFAVAAALVLVLPLLGVSLPIPRRLGVLGLFGLSALFLLIALVVTPIDCNVGGFDTCEMVNPGHGFGYWLALLAAAAGTALAAMRRGAE